MSRYRISAHILQIEAGRYTCPVIPILDRKSKQAEAEVMPSSDLVEVEVGLIRCKLDEVKCNLDEPRCNLDAT